MHSKSQVPSDRIQDKKDIDFAAIQSQPPRYAEELHTSLSCLLSPVKNPISGTSFLTYLNLTSFILCEVA